MDLMWSFPRPDPDADDLVAAGADLRPETLVAAYAAGYFPMPLVHSPLDLLRHAGPDAPGSAGTRQGTGACCVPRL